MDPKSPESQEYFTLKRRAHLKALACQLNANEDPITSSTTSSVGDSVAQTSASPASLESKSSVGGDPVAQPTVNSGSFESEGSE